MITKKGQVSIELIILVGMLIIGAVVLSVTLISSYNKNIETTDDTAKKQSNLVDNFVDDLDDVQSGSSAEQVNQFSVTISNPRPISYLPGNVSFNIFYDYNVGPVTCEWDLSSDTFGEQNFQGCSTLRNLGVGDYTANYTVKDSHSTRAGTVLFRVNN